tara:strand:+ start:277 stop:717 length:441 start_codon:yes stop_codon:yes gene_type:complete
MDIIPGDIYSVRIGDRTMFAIRGDDLFKTEDEAVRYRDIAAKRAQERRDAIARADLEAKTEQAKEAAYVASFRGFVTQGRESGRRRQVLGKKFLYNGTPMSRKAIVEKAYTEGAHVNARGDIEYPDGRFVNIGKTAADYLNHLNTQ